MREIIARVVDGSRFHEFKPAYGANLLTGWASLAGYEIGILANQQGVLFSAECKKAAQFIQLANRHQVPLIFIQNVTGYMVGKQYEQGGIIKHGALMINAVSNSTVPHITLQIGGSYGAGNYGMCGYAYKPRFVFVWPNAKTAVMGPQQLAGVMSIVRRAAAAAAGKPFDEQQDALCERPWKIRSRRSRWQHSPAARSSTTESSILATREPSWGSHSRRPCRPK